MCRGDSVADEGGFWLRRRVRTRCCDLPDGTWMERSSLLSSRRWELWAADRRRSCRSDHAFHERQRCALAACAQSKDWRRCICVRWSSWTYGSRGHQHFVADRDSYLLSLERDLRRNLPERCMDRAERR